MAVSPVGLYGTQATLDDPKTRTVEFAFAQQIINQKKDPRPNLLFPQLSKFIKIRKRASLN